MVTKDPGARALKLSVDSLHNKHHDLFNRALQNILSRNAAELTYAQIVDGLPISSVEEDSMHGSVDYGHPIHTKHTTLCPGVLERLREIRNTHELRSLKFNSTLVHAYNSAPPGSRAFQTRLIEIIAVAIHQIAVQLFKSETGFHKNDEMTSWQPPLDSTYWQTHKRMPPTLFRHTQYRDYDQYPDGLADGVGYWAENRIFGGVVLFDRRDPQLPLNISNEVEVDPNAIYFHSDGCNVTYRIYQLTDNQRQALLKFLLSEITPPAECPLPIHGTDDNRRRIDPEEATMDTGVYRDPWERKPLGPDDWDPRDRDVINQIDYPTLDHFRRSAVCAGLRKQRCHAYYLEKERQPQHEA
ncbi:hypothetical protein F4859DRAFT_511820 [Xylaria cf. heliscus]|nr:hypothetical protein F4859DRAFT_511820 [Xylaria cf. heliscus]